MRAAWTPIVLLGLMALASGSASAHENARVAVGSERILAGAALELDASVHHHRLAGTVHIIDARGGGPLRIVIDGPAGRNVVAGPGDALRVNALIACCDDATWTAHVVRVENIGPRAVDVELALALLHDGLSVAADRAETGAAGSMLIFVALPAAIALWPRHEQAVRARAFRASALCLGAAWLLVAALAIPAVLTFGGGPAAGLVASAARLPWLPNPIVTTQDVVMLALFALWGVAVVQCAKAVRAAPEARAPRLLAVALVGTALLGGSAWALEYGAALVPVPVTMIAVAAPLAWAIPLTRRRLLAS